MVKIHLHDAVTRVVRMNDERIALAKIDQMKDGFSFMSIPVDMAVDADRGFAVSVKLSRDVSEVQEPLATAVGGPLAAMNLTLLVLPAHGARFSRRTAVARAQGTDARWPHPRAA